MTKRKQLSKKIRFEVFKRDGFKCQYCGRMAPDVILEVDHVNPVANGGENDILNLVTSCRDCNRGKGKKQLSDKSVIAIQQKQLTELNEKRLQLEMMIQWKNELIKFEDEQVSQIEKILKSATGYGYSDYGRKECKKRIKEFGFELVLRATSISIDTYYDGTDESADITFKRIGGICFNIRKAGADNGN